MADTRAILRHVLVTLSTLISPLSSIRAACIPRNQPDKRLGYPASSVKPEYRHNLEPVSKTLRSNNK